MFIGLTRLGLAKEATRRGVERLVDPGFDNPVYWTPGVGWAVTGGQLVATAAAAATYTLTALNQPLVAGRTYQVTLTCTSFTSGSWKLLQEGGASYFGDKTSAGTFTGILTASNNGHVYVWANATLTASFDNISVKELY